MHASECLCTLQNAFASHSKTLLITVPKFRRLAHEYGSVKISLIWVYSVANRPRLLARIPAAIKALVCSSMPVPTCTHLIALLVPHGSMPLQNTARQCYSICGIHSEIFFIIFIMDHKRSILKICVVLHHH